VEGELKHLLETTEVTKISANHDRSHLRIYLLAQRLIFKKNIWKLEEEIKKQIFPNHDISIKIYEKFQLSEQYTAESLMDVYKDSILEELNAYSVFVYNLLRTAKMEFDRPDHLRLTLEETIIAKTRTDDLVDFLEKVFCERCGRNLIIEVAYVAPQESKYRKNAENQIRQEVKSIMERTKFALNEEDGSQPEVAQTEENPQDIAPSTLELSTNSADKNYAKNPDNEGKNAKVKPAFEKKGEFRRKFERDSYKKSTNPDIIYGRDFEEEPIAISKVDGPIGEVVIKGKIIALDTREIRNERTIVIFNVTDFTDTMVLKLFSKNED
jgi:DNA polymerase-3 subunit alpha (Gram-positive type)